MMNLFNRAIALCLIAGTCGFSQVLNADDQPASLTHIASAGQAAWATARIEDRFAQSGLESVHYRTTRVPIPEIMGEQTINIPIDVDYFFDASTQEYWIGRRPDYLLKSGAKMFALSGSTRTLHIGSSSPSHGQDDADQKAAAYIANIYETKQRPEPTDT